MSWHRLPELYEGPVVIARLFDPSARLRGDDSPAFVECWALLDTGATHSVIDTEQVVGRLGLAQHDRRYMAGADRAHEHTPVYEAGVSFPDFGFPRRRVRMTGMKLPGPFWMLIGMDLLRNTRLAMEWRQEARWLRWESLGTE